MKTTLITISLLLFLTAGQACAEKEPEILHGLSAVSYSAGFSMVAAFSKMQVDLAPEMVMSGLEDARNSIRPNLPKGKMRLILRDPKQYLLEDRNKYHPQNESKALYGLAAVSYAAGFRMGDTFKKQRVPLVPDMVARGLEDARNSIPPLLPFDEMRTILRDPKKYLIVGANQDAEQKKKSAEEFLSANAQKEGITVLENGLQYKILSVGSGESPKFSDSVRIAYQASTINGQVYDSTEKAGKPAVLALNSVIPGLAEGLQLMTPGAKWELYIPSALAYRDYGPLADQALIYLVELIEVVSAETSE